MRRLASAQFWKDARVAAAAAAVLLLAAGFGVAWLSQEDLHGQKLEQAESHARVLAASVTGALAFSDRAEAEESVHALFANPAVDAVGIYFPDGSAFVLQQAGSRAPPASLTATSVPRLIEGRAIATVPVEQETLALGRVYVSLITETAITQWMRYLGPGLLLLMALIMLVVVSTSQHQLSLAHRRLAERADDLARANDKLVEEMAERRKAQAALAQAQKMEAIGQLTGGLAHDFNNLLAAVGGGIRLLERQEDPVKRKSIHTALSDAVQRGAKLTRQLLTFARAQSLEVKVVDPYARFDAMRDLLQRSVGEETVIRLERTGGAALVAVDPEQLDLAILNLAVNARDAMPKGGALTISIGCPPREVLGEWVRISVSDNGEGMSPETMERAFEPFFTTKDVGRGSGLGLAQVYAFARQSCGAVMLESSLGNGTTVHIDLPQSHAEQGQDEKEGAPAVFAGEPPRGSGQRILVVEDDDAVGQTVCQIVEANGYKCTRASTAAEAVALLGQDTFDLLFTDIIMPGGMDGVELARSARARWPNMPVLLTTGYSGKARMAPDEFEVIFKPWQPAELLWRLHLGLHERTRAHKTA